MGGNGTDMIDDLLRQAMAQVRAATIESRLALAMSRLQYALKAGYDPNQPRRRDGTPQSGWWTRKPTGRDAVTPRIRVADLVTQLEALGGGKPYQENSPSGATQFIFPNGMVLRFDLLPGQYRRGQEPHINIQWPTRNINHHVPLG